MICSVPMVNPAVDENLWRKIGGRILRQDDIVQQGINSLILIFNQSVVWVSFRAYSLTIFGNVAWHPKKNMEVAIFYRSWLLFLLSKLLNITDLILVQSWLIHCGTVKRVLVLPIGLQTGSIRPGIPSGPPGSRGLSLFPCHRNFPPLSLNVKDPVTLESRLPKGKPCQASKKSGVNFWPSSQVTNCDFEDPRFRRPKNSWESSG